MSLEDLSISVEKLEKDNATQNNEYLSIQKIQLADDISSNLQMGVTATACCQ